MFTLPLETLKKYYPLSKNKFAQFEPMYLKAEWAKTDIEN